MRAFLLAALMVVAVACGGSSEESTGSTSTTSNPATTTSTGAPATTTTAAASCLPAEVAVESTVGHVIGDDNSATYDFHPPTGGLHRGTGPEPGVLDAPVPEPDQVGGLEAGKVFLQYAAGADPAAVAVLVEAAGQRDLVVVAPAAGEIDRGHPVAFTAWDNRQLCTSPTLEDALAFIDAHAGDGPGH